MLRRLLKIAAISALTLLVLAAAGVWLAVHDEVAAVRKMAKRAPTPPPLVTAAVVATEGFSNGPITPSLRALDCLKPRVVCCGPGPLAFRLVRPGGGRVWHRHAESILSGVVISHLFTPDELLAVYMNELYLGRVDGRELIGVEAASAAYFGKTASALSVGEAATLAAILRSPNYYSPLTHPDRALMRRNLALRSMCDKRVLSESEYQRAVAAPMQTRRPRHVENAPRPGSVDGWLGMVDYWWMLQDGPLVV